MLVDRAKISAQALRDGRGLILVIEERDLDELGIADLRVIGDDAEAGAVVAREDLQPTATAGIVDWSAQRLSARRGGVHGRSVI